MIKYKRWIYFLLILITIPAGLATRKYAGTLPWFIAEYGGDILYATFIFFAFRFVFTRYRLLIISCITYLFCIAIEISQLYHAPWMELLRHTPPFGLILGYGFLWSDWLCYLAGTLLAFFISWLIENCIPGSLKDRAK